MKALSRAGRHKKWRILAMWWLLLSSLPATALPAQESDPGNPWQGLPLAQALERLRAEGLNVVFSSRVVLPWMHVEAEPETEGARAVLDEILAPHGLVGQDGSGGAVIVLRRSASRGPGGELAADGTLLVGTLVSRHNGAPLRGVRVRIPEANRTTTTGLEGTFRMPALPPGKYTVEADAPGFLPEQLVGVHITSGQPTQVGMTLQPTPVTLDEIVVTPSRLTLLKEEPGAPLALSRHDIFTLPHLGDDVFRTLSLLPGIAANDVTAQFSIRGGRRDEVQILLDGQELFDAYHLKDFDNALSIIGQEALGEVELSTGGFAAQYGDRMSGVLDMRTMEVLERRHQLGLSLLTVQAGTAGTFHDGRGSWLALLRRGSADLVGRILQDENPSYWDLLAKGEHRVGTHHRLRLNLLQSQDRWDLQDVTDDGEEKDFNTAYNRAYAWLTHEALVGSRALVESATSWSGIDRDRRGREDEEEQRFTVLDERAFEVRAVRQHWDVQVSTAGSWKGGFAFRRFKADFDYFREVEFETPIAEIRDPVVDEVTAFTEAFIAEHRGVYTSFRHRPLSQLTVEGGLRRDRHTLTDETLWSPRFNLAWSLPGRAGRSTVLRAAWGVFRQSHRPYELPVEDSSIRFEEAERSEQALLGLEHAFRPFRSAERRQWILRLEVYRRRIENPRQRFENLYEGINQFPEIEPDRVRLNPVSSEAEGVELFLKGALTPRLDFWFNATYASVEDEALNQNDIRRGIDQPTTLNATLRSRLGNWNLNLAWRYRTGWPTTPLLLEEVVDEETGETEFAPVLGDLFSERLPDHHRLDARLSRRWQRRSGTLLFFVDVQNLYDRNNVAGFDLEVDDEAGEILREPELWPGFFLSLGVRWEF